MSYKQLTADGVSTADIQNATHTYAEDAEASDAYAIVLDPVLTAYASGQTFIFKANTANTGASSLNVDGLGAKTLKKLTDQDTATGDIEAGSIVEVTYDGTNFQIISVGAQSGETATSLGTLIGSADDATPNDTDLVATALTAGGILKKITWTNVKAFLKTYFDTLYEVLLVDGNSGDFLQTDGAGGYTFQAVTSGSVDSLRVQVRNESGSTISKGDVVYISGYSVGEDIALVSLADANGSSTYPALGFVLDATINNNATGIIITSGKISGVDTSAFSVGDNVYVSETAGALSTRPTASGSEVQKMGIVLRSHATLGVIEIVGAGRTNDIPNNMSDAILKISDDGDMTKTIAFQASGITTATTRTITMPDTNVDLGDIATNTAKTGVTTQISNVVEDTTPQLGGNLDLNDKNIEIEAVPADDTSTGLVVSAHTLGATIAVGELVYLGSGGKWLIADASAIATCGGMLGVCLVAGNDTDATKVLLQGYYRDDSQFAWTIGDTVYASETAGDFTATPPTTTDALVRVVGFAVSADVLYFNPSQDNITVV
jgi:hypothetical protein